MIPIFPKNKKLSLKDKKDIELITKKFPPYSDYNFTSLWSYNTKNKINISLLNNNLIVKFQDYTINSQFYSIIGKNNIIKTIEEVFEYLEKSNQPPILKLIPETMIRDDTKIQEYFDVKEDRDNHDYIISAESTAKLLGPKYHNKHSLINKFKKLYIDHKFVMFNIKDREKQKEIIEVFEKWLKNKNRKDDESEKLAITRLLNSAEHFDLVAFGLYHKDMIGFSIFENLNNEYAIGHFMKADKSYRGVFEILYHHNAKHFHSKGIKFINIEQDLGKEGLRLTKSLWRPVHFLKKYTIEKK